MKGNGQHTPSTLSAMEAVTERMRLNKARAEREARRRDFLSAIDLESIKLEDGIPLPPAGTPKRSVFPLPFDRMEVGQSFWIPWPADGKFSHSGAASRKMRPKRFSSRRQKGPDGRDGVRVWRVA